MLTVRLTRVVWNVYPDARLVVTHRDPMFTVPSSVSLSMASRPNALTRGLDTNGY